MTNAERIKMDHMTGWRQEKIKGQLKEETDESKSWTGIQWIKKKNQKTENRKTEKHLPDIYNNAIWQSRRCGESAV